MEDYVLSVHTGSIILVPLALSWGLSDSSSFSRGDRFISISVKTEHWFLDAPCAKSRSGHYPFQSVSKGDFCFFLFLRGFHA